MTDRSTFEVADRGAFRPDSLRVFHGLLWRNGEASFSSVRHRSCKVGTTEGRQHRPNSCDVRQILRTGGTKDLEDGGAGVSKYAGESSLGVCVLVHDTVFSDVPV